MEKTMRATLCYGGGYLVKSKTEIKGRGIKLYNTGVYGFRYKMTEKAFEKYQQLCKWEDQEF